MVGGTIVIRVSALEPVVMGCFWGGDSAFLGWGCFGLLIFLVGEGVFRGGDSAFLGGGCLGLLVFWWVVGCFGVVTASRGGGRFSECGSFLGTSGCW